MTNGIVELYSESGEITRYRKLSQRLPEFLAQYGPEQGYATVTEIVDWLSLKPGLLRLYEIAIQAGHKPEDVGLPSVSATSRTQVCRATLVDGTGRVLGSATATKVVLEYKDLEVLETAARQRLLAALGFGGEVLDGDEAQDQRDQSLQPVAPSVLDLGESTAQEGAVSGESAPPVSDTPVWPAGSTASAPTAEHSDKDDAANAGDPPSGRSDERQATGDQALAMLKRQIAHLAKMQGVKAPPAVTTRDEAQAALKDLLQAQRVF